MFETERTTNRNRLTSEQRCRKVSKKLEKETQTAETDTTISLLDLKKGSSGFIEALIGGCGACSRLMGLGLHRGSKVKVISNENNGPILVEVCGTHVGLGRSICSQIIIDMSISNSDIYILENKFDNKDAEVLTAYECFKTGGD